MKNIREYICPFYQRTVNEDECYDMFMIAGRAFKDEALVKEEDRDSLYKMCVECKKHGLD